MNKILIVGATSTIAEHCAKIWAARGDMLYLVARDEARLMTIAADLHVRGASQVAIFSTDLNDLHLHDQLLDVADITMRGVDIVLIAHGTLPDQKECEESVSTTLAEMETNALSTISLLTRIANRFEAKKKGIICVISSVAGDRGKASNYVYGSAKAMVTTFTSGLRQRLYRSNVAVVTIKPGFVDTPMTAGFKKGFLWSRPNTIADEIVKAVERRKSEVYVPAFWMLIMMMVRTVPNVIFKTLRL